MKSIFRIMILCFTWLALFSCEQELPVYDYQNNMLNFYYKNPSDTLINYSFKYAQDGTKEDIVWVTVQTLGFLSDKDRYFDLEQVAVEKEENAVADVHYLAFDNAEAKKKFVIPANATEAKIPIAVKWDQSLTTKAVSLKVTFKENDEFKMGYKNRSTIKIVITDMLVKPNNWNGIMEHFFGDYGPVKHKIMIDVTGDKWDDDYLVKIGLDDYSVDQGYLMYLARKFYKELQSINAERAAQGLGKLTEADGTEVEFAFGGN